MKFKKEELSNSFVIASNFEGEVLTGLVKKITGTRHFRVTMPGICDMILVRGRAEIWGISVGSQLIEEVIQCIGKDIELMFSDVFA